MLGRKKRMIAYKNLFLNANGELTEDAKIVMADFIRFAKVKTTTHIKGDNGGSKILEGRRQFFNRIWGFLNLGIVDVYRHPDNADQDDDDINNNRFTNPLDAP